MRMRLCSLGVCVLHERRGSDRIHGMKAAPVKERG